MKSIKLFNGHEMPILGFGTWNLPPERVEEALSVALKTGYRHIDCAFVYRNEKEIGVALKKCMKEMNLKREDLFITSKLWCTYFRPELSRKGFEKTLSDLQLGYLDLYLIHWPVPFQPHGDLFPKQADGKFAVDDVPHSEIWKFMESLVNDGLVKSIGLSNFNRRQIDNILKVCKIKPANLQIEVHANFPNTKIVEYAQSVGISVTAYAPLGSPSASPGLTDLLTERWVCDIAAKHKKTPAQVLLRYLIQRGLIVVPKSATPARIVENAQVFDFELTGEEMRILGSSGLNKRQFVLEGMKNHSEYPFSDEY